MLNINDRVIIKETDELEMVIDIEGDMIYLKNSNGLAYLEEELINIKNVQKTLDEHKLNKQ